jgi:hypothetical protein
MTNRTRILLAAAIATCAMSVPARALERSLHDVATPERALLGVTVEDYNGRFVGRVASVTLDRFGDADAVQIDDGSRVVTLDAEDLAYDDRDNIVVAQMSRDDIDGID